MVALLDGELFDKSFLLTSFYYIYLGIPFMLICSGKDACL